MRREGNAARSSKGLPGLGRMALNLALAGCFTVSCVLSSVVGTLLVTTTRPAYAQSGSDSDSGDSGAAPATSPDTTFTSPNTVVFNVGYVFSPPTPELRAGPIRLNTESSLISGTLRM